MTPCLRGSFPASLLRAAPLLSLLALGAGVGAPARAGAQRVVVLPRGPVWGDAERPQGLALLPLDAAGRVASPAVLTVAAARGSIAAPPVRDADGLWRLRYRAPAAGGGRDTLTVRWDGREERLDLPLAAVARTAIAITVAPQPLVLGRHDRAEVRLRVRDATGAPARAGLRLSTNTGSIGVAREVAPGEYVATYRPPRERYPQVALILAVNVADGAFAAHSVSLHAAIVVPGEGEPGGTMRIVVDGRTFGPVAVDEQGRFKLPLVVPPGGRAVGIMVDRSGNTRQREIDLRLPPFRRVVAAALPAEVPVGGGGRTEILAEVVDARGGRARGQPPRMRAERGSLGVARRRPDGSYVAEWTAPREIGGGTVEVVVEGPGGADRVRLMLRPGPPRQLVVRPPPGGFVADGITEQAVAVEVRDGAGNPIDDARLRVSLPHGRVIAVRERGGGRYEVRLAPPPDPGPGAAPLTVEVTGAPPGPPARVSLHALGLPDSGGLAVEAWIDDDFGAPVPAAAVVIAAGGRAIRAVADGYGVARARVPAGADGVHVDAHLAEVPGLRASLDLLRTGSGWRRFAWPAAGAPPAGLSERVMVTLRPALPLDLRVVAPEQVGAGAAAPVRVEARDPAGRPVAVPPLLGQATGASLTPAGAGAFTFTAARAGRYLISVTDPASGVTAVAAVVVR
jgi:hypothetical protein